MTIRLAIVTLGISHFEVPLFRLIATEKGVDLKVYYVLSPHGNVEFDQDYNQGISWGEDMLSGYASEQCEDPREIFSKLIASPPQVVMMYGYNWPGALSLIFKCKKNGFPMILRGTFNYYRDPRNTFLQGLRRYLRPPIFHLFDALHYGGTYSRAIFRRAMVPAERLFFVPYSVDSPYFVTRSDQLEVNGRGDALLNELGWSDCFPIILYIGQLSWFKGPDIAIHVFEKYREINPSARLLVVGNGVRMDEMRQLASTLIKDRAIHFASFVPSKQTPKYYLASDIVLFTSRYETWARSVNEAMLCKRPCIVNKVIPSSGGLVEHGVNGYVTDGADTQGYCRALDEFVSLDPANRINMGEIARKTAIQFSYEANMDAALKSIDYAVSRRSKNIRQRPHDGLC